MAANYPVHIVDDEPSVRESLKLLLTGAGFEVHCYSGAAMFLDHCLEWTGCLLLYLRLRGMDGLELQRELIARKATMQVLMMSAYGDIEHAVTAMRLGAADFIEKPFDPEQLIRRIRALTHDGDEAEAARREARRQAALIGMLTAREQQVLKLVAEGFANRQVAAKLSISARTVETHRSHIMEKLGAESLPHLVRIWLTCAARADAAVG